MRARGRQASMMEIYGLLGVLSALVGCSGWYVSHVDLQLSVLEACAVGIPVLLCILAILTRLDRLLEQSAE